MKILLIHKFHYMLGGTETFHYNLAEALTAAGHEVIFFSMYMDIIMTKLTYILRNAIFIKI